MATREPSPRPGDNPGYAEKHPKDKGESQVPDPRKQPNPDAGGLGRDPEDDGKPDRTCPLPGSQAGPTSRPLRASCLTGAQAHAARRATDAFDLRRIAGRHRGA
jgi:hypothetical protein